MRSCRTKEHDKDWRRGNASYMDRVFLDEYAGFIA